MAPCHGIVQGRLIGRGTITPFTGDDRSGRCSAPKAVFACVPPGSALSRSSIIRWGPCGLVCWPGLPCEALLRRHPPRPTALKDKWRTVRDVGGGSSQKHQQPPGAPLHRTRQRRRRRTSGDDNEKPRDAPPPVWGGERHGHSIVAAHADAGKEEQEGDLMGHVGAASSPNNRGHGDPRGASAAAAARVPVPVRTEGPCGLEGGTRHAVA
ncbi:hypothetical protein CAUPRSCDRAFT_10350 [Caulochytrium protostelioides]|uniref:Uncharacterized protein n=1 Tax=Caulochytrium protostelioides TaxID=1555241 RepID=A0A4P9WZJ9_9FUNG|nr:hypothetical protein CAUPRSCDRAFT_10350 [Caulochytrium protostelioides]